MEGSNDERQSYGASGNAAGARPKITSWLPGLVAVAVLSVLIAGAVGATDIELPGPLSAAPNTFY